MILYCNARERTIETDKGEKVSVDNAKAFAAAGDIEDCNLALQRLEQMDWDFDKLNEFYDNAD